MTLFVGGNEITDVKIGAEDINEIYIGPTLVWQRLSVTMNPANGIGYDVKFDSNATARVDLTATANVAWSFVLVSGTSIGLTYGPSSGTSTYVQLFRAGSTLGISMSTVDVTATLNGKSVTNRVNLAAEVDTLGGEGGGPLV